MGTSTPAPSPSSAPPVPATANEFIEQQLDERLRSIEAAFSSHALTFCGPLYAGVDDILRTAVEKKCQQPPVFPKLVVLLTTNGGYLEPVQRMVATLRRHYQTVDFVIPNHAYSAGTVFAMSGDAIHMDYYSRLGPIDPQIESSQGRMVSALGHLARYNTLIEKAQLGTITAAEVQLLIDGFDQAELYDYEQAKELSIAVLEEWLVKYKFKNWTETESRKLPVTEQMKKDRASFIGKELNNTERWHSHGYGISMEVLRADLKMVIDDYGESLALCSAIRPYHNLLSDYMGRRGSQGIVHIPGDYRPFM
jgi:Serine dehydrogenase proteinase